MGVINHGDEDYKVTKMDDCDELCPVRDFYKNLRDVIPEYKETLCLYEENTNLSKIFDFDLRNFNANF